MFLCRAGNIFSLGSCPAPHHQPAVMSNTHTTSRGILDQTPASTAGRICDDDDLMEWQRENFVFLPICASFQGKFVCNGWQANKLKRQRLKRAWLLSTCTNIPPHCLSVISFSLIAVKLKAGVKQSQAVLRLTLCVDHLCLVRCGHTHHRHFLKANLIYF